jgi:hypothetical protein
MNDEQANKLAAAARETLAANLDPTAKRLRRLITDAREPDGQSFGLLVARLSETHDQLGWTIDEARDYLAHQAHGYD